MKNNRILPLGIALFFLATLAAPATNLRAQGNDSMAAFFVDRYLNMLNINGLPQDSMLVMTTTITTVGSDDTIIMKRYYQTPQMFRVDVTDRLGLQTGLYSNGKEMFRSYAKGKGWGFVSPEKFHTRLTGFDFRGPLYGWRTKGLMMNYIGETTVQDKGEMLDAVRVAVEGMYTRIYMFEKSGLLSVIIELDEGADERSLLRDTHIEWKCIHEYQQIGTSVLPSLESFKRGDEVTVLRTAYHFEKRDDYRFNHD